MKKLILSLAVSLLCFKGFAQDYVPTPENLQRPERRWTDSFGGNDPLCQES